MLPHPDATGLAPNEKRPLILQISPVSNLTWPIEDRNISYFIPSGKYPVIFMNGFINYLLLKNYNRG